MDIDDEKENLANLFFQCARYERPSTDWIAALDSYTDEIVETCWREAENHDTGSEAAQAIRRKYLKT